jgi:HTH-type transcriptional regulator / antitoxin HipB
LENSVSDGDGTPTGFCAKEAACYGAEVSLHCYRTITLARAWTRCYRSDTICLPIVVSLPIGIMIVRTSIELGNALRARRRELGLAQEDIAGVIGVNRRVIGELERGKGTVQLQIAMEVARALGLDVELAPRRK